MEEQTYPTLERNLSIAARVQANESLTDIGKDLGLTRERVRQIAKRHGARSNLSPEAAKERWRAKFAEWKNDVNALPDLAAIPDSAKRMPEYRILSMLLAERKIQLRARPGRLQQIQEITALADELGRTPRRREYVARFGNWRQDRWGSYNQLVKAAGLVPVSPGSKGHLPQERRDNPNAVPVAEAVTGEGDTVPVQHPLDRGPDA